MLPPKVTRAWKRLTELLSAPVGFLLAWCNSDSDPISMDGVSAGFGFAPVLWTTHTTSFRSLKFKRTTKFGTIMNFESFVKKKYSCFSLLLALNGYKTFCWHGNHLCNESGDLLRELPFSINLIRLTPTLRAAIYLWGLVGPLSSPKNCHLSALWRYVYVTSIDLCHDNAEAFDLFLCYSLLAS